MRIMENGVMRDATPEEIAAWEEAASQPAPPPSPQDQTISLARAMAASVTTLTDTTALAIPDLLPTWGELLASGSEIPSGVCLNYNNQIYRVVQNVKPIESQKPGDEGMLAIYRPIDKEHAGTISDPIPWINGMDCYKGKYYSYEGKKYLCNGDMIPCTWAPGTDGVHQWELVEGGE